MTIKKGRKQHKKYLKIEFSLKKNPGYSNFSVFASSPQKVIVEKKSPTLRPHFLIRFGQFGAEVTPVNSH
jgi:hypothetical protein